MHSRLKTLHIYLLVTLLIFLTIILTFLASRYSLWGDEFDSIAGAFLPWHGGHDFWWQIKQYNANPPGDNLIDRILFRTPFLNWLYFKSQEIFWRVPSIFAYTLTCLTLFLLSFKRYKSPLTSFLILFLFLLIPFPFNFATEARFYSWLILFMTLSVWQTIQWIKSDFKFSELIKLIILTSLGVCFHVALALNCYFIFWVGLFRFASGAINKRTYLKKLSIDLIVCLIPLLVFKFEKHWWIFLPSGVGLKAVFWTSVIQALKEIPQILNQLSPWGKSFTNIWITALISTILVLKTLYSFKKGKRSQALIGLYLAFLFFGGSFLLLASGNANHYTVSLRSYLFEVPVILSILEFTILDPLQKYFNKCSMATIDGLIVCLFLASAFQINLFGSHFSDETPVKTNLPLHEFKDFYSRLPDKKQLLLVGVDDEHPEFTDSKMYIGGAEINYLKDFKPEFLNIRKINSNKISLKKWNWTKFDVLIFVSLDQARLDFPELPIDKMKCVPYRSGIITFCRKD